MSLTCKRKVSTRTRFAVFARDNHTCQYCGAKAPDVTLHVDHIHPVSKGGSNQSDNLITACAKCNLGKADIVHPTMAGALAVADTATLLQIEHEAVAQEISKRNVELDIAEAKAEAAFDKYVDEYEKWRKASRILEWYDFKNAAHIKPTIYEAYRDVADMGAEASWSYHEIKAESAPPQKKWRVLSAWNPFAKKSKQGILVATL